MHFTQNPIGSDDQLDLQDNAISFDYAMNSPAALWQDRFGKQHKTVQQALKDVGFKPAVFDFVGGGTLGIGDRDKCVFYPTDGYWYSWNGKLPYVVPANSSPTPGGKKGWGVVTRDDRVIAREALRRTYLEVGLNLVSGSFEQGGTLQSVRDVLLHEKTGKGYFWSGGGFPKTVYKYQDQQNTIPSPEEWKEVSPNGKKEVVYLEDFLPDLFGNTDYSDVVQKVVNDSSVVVFGKGRCKISTVNWPKQVELIGSGSGSVFVVSENIDLFSLPSGGRFSNFAVEITNPDYTSNIFIIKTSMLEATKTGRENDDRIECCDIKIRATASLNNKSSLNCTAIKILADANGVGAYKHAFKNIDMHRSGRPVDIETTGTNAWVNSNIFTGITAFGTDGVVKMKNSGVNSEIRDNVIDVNFQNDVNFPGSLVYDIPTTFNIKDNKLSGYIWDVHADQTKSGGCKYGNAGLNTVITAMTSSNTFENKYLYLGSLSDVEGISFVDLGISRYAHGVDTIKIAIVAGVPDVRYHNTTQNLGLDFRYQKIGNIFYIFLKSSVTYLDVMVTNSSCFTPWFYTSPLTSVPNSSPISLPLSRRPVTANNASAITGFDFIMTMMDRLKVGEITNINEIPIGGNERGVTMFTCPGNVIGLQNQNQVGCILFDKGNITGENNYGSNIIALNQDGEILIRTYKNGWGGWSKVSTVPYP